MNLYDASNQWAQRPADERFPNVKAAWEAARALRAMSHEMPAVPLNTLRTEAEAAEVVLVGRKNVPARMTYSAFGQLSRQLGAPASYLRTLPPTLACQNLNHSLSRVGEDQKAVVYALRNGAWLVRALTSDVYARIFHSDVLERLTDLLEYGWRVPPARPAKGDQVSRPATEADVLEIGGGGGLSVQVGDLIADAGIYLGQGTPELFVFLINERNRIQDGTEGGLSRGVFVSNSELGDRAFRITQFLFRHVCGNHIVWGAEKVQELKIRHVGSANRRAWSGMRWELTRYAEGAAGKLEERIRVAKGYLIGQTKDKVLDTLFGKGITSRKALETGYQLAERNSDTDGDPRAAWGMAQGLTRASQAEVYADARAEMDRAAGRVLEMPF